MKTHVVKTSPEMSLAEAVDLMDLYQVSGLPVVDESGHLCGMLTESDVLRALFSAESWGNGLTTQTDLNRAALCRSRSMGSRQVREWMAAPAESVLESWSAIEAAELMFGLRLKRVAVVDEKGSVIGTLNRIDLIQAIFEGAL